MSFVNMKITASTPGIRLMGRMDPAQDPLALDWTGSGIEFRFRGTMRGEGRVGLYWTSTTSFPGVDFEGGRGYNVNKDVYQAYAFCCNSWRGDITDGRMFLTQLRSIHCSIRPVRSK